MIADLKLMAAGANGGEVCIDDDMFQSMQACMNPSAFSNFARAVKSEWFTDAMGYYFEPLFIFELGDIEKWSNFETLADAIIEERKRIDAVEKQKASEE